ncbi:MAG: hypothetical protein KME29_03075 [Calothrix sp. FI2-JRJ7]|jgi:hypothetical protein|nr:hypothetical protein [Calothrix sp. FI2-JRJ7]
MTTNPPESINDRFNGFPIEIKLGDLLEFFNEELREFDVTDYGYVSGDARKKPLKQKDKDAPVSEDGKIAA